MRNICKYLGALLISLLSVIAVIGCGVQEIYSSWCGNMLTNDGIDYCGALKNSRHPIADGAVMTAVYNNEDTFFLYLSIHDQAIQKQISAGGFTVWLDAEGGKKKIYGIRYPIGVHDGDKERPPRQGLNNHYEEKWVDDKRYENMKGDMEIFGPGENEHSRMVAEDSTAHGIQCRLRNSNGDLIYELRVPLMRSPSSPYGIAMNTVKIIGIGLETGAGDNSRLNMDVGVQTGGGRGGGTRGAEGGTSGGPGGGNFGTGGGSDGRVSMKLNNQWLKVYLAVKP